MSLIAELKRRNVIRMAMLYGVGSWLILQVGDLLFDLMGLPDWALRIVLGILILGAPVALVFSWLYELTPEGLKRDRDVDPEQSITPETGRRLNHLTLVVAVLAIVLVAYQQFIGAPKHRQLPDSVAPEAEPALVQEQAVAPDQDTQQSIAVLPFRDMSAAGDQDYFAEGIAEELLNALVRIEGLRVASRTSSFSFKGQSVDLTTIADRLGVTHLLEGSIRTAGNQVRVTAQLIEVSNDAHLWSETYDRTLDDIFAIQDEITSQVIEALEVHLAGSTELPSAQEVLTDNPEAYRLYLQGRHQWRMRNVESLHAAEDLLTQAVALDPGFARAWSALSVTRHVLPDYDASLSQAAQVNSVLEATEKALALDSDIGEALAVKADVLEFECRFAEAEAFYRRAIEAEPDDATAYHWYSNFLRQSGYFKDGVAQITRAFELDPLNASIVFNMAWAESMQGNTERGLELLREAARLGIFYGSTAFQGLLLSFAGDLDRAGPLLRDPGPFMQAVDPAWVDEFLAVLHNPSLRDEKETTINALLQPGNPYFRHSVLVAIDSPLALEVIGDNCYAIADTLDLWRPTVGIRQQPQFESVMTAAGLMDFWRERGWPDLCRENDAGVFQCD
jgi:TolB-like protein